MIDPANILIVFGIMLIIQPAIEAYMARREEQSELDELHWFLPLRVRRMKAINVLFGFLCLTVGVIL